MQTPTRTAIVTGASSGFGQGIAKVLAHNGYRTFITGRNQEKLDSAAASVGAIPVVADVTKEEDWDRVLSSVLAVSPTIDVLVNNAGGGGTIAPVIDQSDDAILESLLLNLGSVMLGCRRVAPVMRAQRSGTIINISSVCAKYSWPGWSVYSAAKAGVERFGKGLYTELRDSGVRVTTVTPSWGATGFFDSLDVTGHPSTETTTRAQCIHPEELGRVVWDIVQLPAHLEILETTVVPMVQEIVPL